MALLVTIEEAKRNMRVDHDLDDDDIGRKIRAASAAVLAYIEDAQYLFLDTGGDLIEFDTSDTGTQPEEAALRALDLAKQATILLVAHWYKNPAPTSDRGASGYLPAEVVATLYSLRTPSVA